jgi:hypothetical protein
LGDLLFHLSGCGITSRRPIQDFSEFITGATNNILEPVKQDLGEQDETINAVLSMAEAFVKHGNLQTVRGIEEYIIVTARVSYCRARDVLLLTMDPSTSPVATNHSLLWSLRY